MKHYTTYIVDDEPLAIVSIKKKLEAFPELKIIGESTRMAKAVHDINANQPDILFLDIQLGEGTGFDLLNNVDFSGKVVCISAHNDYAYKAFEVNALDFLLKPISAERLQSTFNKIKQNDVEKINIPVESESIKYKYSDRIMAYDKNQIRFVMLDSIMVISAARDYTTIETVEGKKILMLRSMSEWEERLPQEHFVRIHRSHIVNLNFINKILRHSTSSAMVYINNHTEPVTLSRTYYKNIKSKYL